jgi:hypothetical protein
VYRAVSLSKSPPIPTICSGIHRIETFFFCANAVQAASKYDVVGRIGNVGEKVVK